ncbi:MULTISPECIES: PaaI family thioesterase [Deferrisoma]
MTTLLLPSFRSCFFCGTENPRGWGIRYRVEPSTGRVEGAVRADPAFCGYPGVVHGGIQAALLDDVMYWAVAWRAGTSSVTVGLSTRFRAVAPTGAELRLEARVVSSDERDVRAAGTLLGPDGRVLCEAEGTYRLHAREVFERDMLPFLEFGGCPPEVVGRFRGRG